MVFKWNVKPQNWNGKKKIANYFSRWINKRIEAKDESKRLILGVEKEKNWKNIFSPLLSDFNAITEAGVQSMIDMDKS